MKRFRVLLLFALMLFARIYSFAEVSCDNCIYSLKADISCGPKALLVVCEKLGIKTTLDKLKILSRQSADGVTLANLYDAALQEKLTAAAMKLSINQLNLYDGIAIAYLWGGYFVIVESNGKGIFNITDPSQDNIKVDTNLFKTLYSGFCLLVAKTDSQFPIIKLKEPDLRVDTLVANLGIIEEGNKIERKINIINAGEAPLEIKKVRSSCGCLTASKPNNTIAPNAMDVILLILDTSGIEGKRRMIVYIETNDPITPIIQISIEAEIINQRILISTQYVDFGIVRWGEQLQKLIYFKDSTGQWLQNVNVMSESPLIKAVLEPIKDNKLQCLILFQPKTYLGPFNEKVIITTNQPKQPSIIINIKAIIYGPIKTKPEMVFFGFVKQNERITKEIVVSTLNKKAIEIKNAKTTIIGLTIKIAKLADNDQILITAILDTAGIQGRIDGTILLETNDPEMPTYTVPVFGYIEG